MQLTLGKTLDACRIDDTYWPACLNQRSGNGFAVRPSGFQTNMCACRDYSPINQPLGKCCVSRLGVVNDFRLTLAIDEQHNVEFAFGNINANHASGFVHRSYLPRMQALAIVAIARPKLLFGMIERDMSRSTYLTHKLLA